MKRIKLLLAEDDATLGKVVKESLINLGFDVLLVHTGEDAIAKINHEIDMYILDVMMPIQDGWTVAQKIRTLFPEKPLIFLTALSETKDIVMGYQLGANDYIRKPFSIEELHLRINELIKRNSKEIGELALGKYTFHPNRQHLVFDNTTVIKLSYKETELLKRLVYHKNELLDKVKVMREIWGDDNFFTSRNLDVYITKLRKKLAQDQSIEIINIRGFGYKLLIIENPTH